MGKTIDDELFMEIMHFSRAVRRHMMGEWTMPQAGQPDQPWHPGRPPHPGFDGADGGPGFAGHPGHPGHSGFDGADGAPGFAGHHRHPGHSGFDGADGAPGFAGCRGRRGFADASGTPDFECPPPGRGPRGRRRPVLSRERILTALAEHEEGLRQKQLSEYMHVNASSISEFINRLEDDGYIVRNVDPSDKRATLISLTEKGNARASELQDERNQKLQQLFQNLTEEEKQELLRLIRKMKE